MKSDIHLCESRDLRRDVTRTLEEMGMWGGGNIWDVGEEEAGEIPLFTASF